MLLLAIMSVALAGCGGSAGDARTPTDGAAREELRTQLRECGATDPGTPSDLERCMEVAIEDAVPILDLRVVPVARRVAAAEPRLEGACHMAMHPIGEAAIKGHDAQELVSVVSSIQDSQCDAGFVHGVLVGAGDAGSDEALDGIVAACDLEQDPAGQAGCVHGLGHVARRRTDTVRAAAGWCGRIARDRAIDCMLGMFHDLQLAAAGSDSGGPPPSDADEDFAVDAGACSMLRGPAALSCAWRLGMERGVKAWPRALSRGASTPSAAARSIAKVCSTARWRPSRAACITGAVRALRGPGGPLPAPAQLVRTCDALPAGDQDACVHALFDLTPSTRAASVAACRTAGDAVREACGWWIGHLGAMGLGDPPGTACAPLDPASARGCRAGARQVRWLGVL